MPAYAYVTPVLTYWVPPLYLPLGTVQLCLCFPFSRHQESQEKERGLQVEAMTKNLSLVKKPL